MAIIAEIRASAAKRLGRAGEECAKEFLENLGYRVFARNVRLSRDEIDLIAFDPQDRVIVFAEVKTRGRTGGAYHPSMDATWRKCAKLRRSARRWVMEHDYRGGYRIDLLCVQGGRVTDHIRELGWE